MEGVLLAVGTGVLAGASAFVALSGDVAVRSPGLLTRAAVRRGATALRRIGQTRLVGWVLSTGPGGRLAAEVASAPVPTVLGLGPSESAAAVSCGVLLASLASGVLLGSPLAGLVSAAALVALVVARDASARQRLRREVLGEMPGVYRALSMAMASGQTLAQAVEYVGSHERGPAASVFARMSLRLRGPAASVFARMSLRLRCGVGTEEAVRLLADELDVPGAELLAAALVISHRTGSPLRDLLLRSARLAERQGEFERLLTVKTAQVRLSVRIVCLLPVVMVGVLTLVSPDFQKGLLTPSGVGCVAGALLLDGVALLLIRKIMRGVM